MSNSVGYVSPTSFRIAATAPAGIQDPIAANAIQQLYNVVQNLISSLVNDCGIGPQLPNNWSILAGSPSTLLAGNLNRLYVTASENIAVGAMVNLYNDVGTLTARNANAIDNTKPCFAYCPTDTGAIQAGATGEVVLNNGATFIGGLTVGAPYWLATNSGQITPSAPVGSGNIEQFLGLAIDANTLSFNVGPWIQH